MKKKKLRREPSPTIEATLSVHATELRRLRGRLDLIISLLTVGDAAHARALGELKAHTESLAAATVAAQPLPGDPTNAEPSP
jgi:hypothetical protein